MFRAQFPSCNDEFPFLTVWRCERCRCDAESATAAADKHCHINGRGDLYNRRGHFIRWAAFDGVITELGWGGWGIWGIGGYRALYRIAIVSYRIVLFRNAEGGSKCDECQSYEALELRAAVTSVCLDHIRLTSIVAGVSLTESRRISTRPLFVDFWYLTYRMPRGALWSLSRTRANCRRGGFTL